MKKLDQFAKKDAAFNLKTSDLPPGEIAARDAESKATGKELLHSKGPDFEFKLLVSQSEATKYASHLAKVTAANEPDGTRRKWFLGLSDQMGRFYEEVARLLRSNKAA